MHQGVYPLNDNLSKEKAVFVIQEKKTSIENNSQLKGISHSIALFLCHVRNDPKTTSIVPIMPHISWHIVTYKEMEH